ncbi:hypothetical protein [Salinispora mooreana]|uniref:hypothetical protein n=1 Tax=Salinispora mooreana TaxID=999545 RepID=UPI00036EA2BF|nr:hypothetical protein [Salinispora mooreana]
MQPMQQPQPPAKKKGNPVVAAVGLLVVAGLCGIGGIVVLSGNDEPQDPVSANRDITAEIMCEQFIERELRAPATAEYTDPTTRKDGATYTVNGAVDSENGFGAKIRSEYNCIVTDSGDDKWTLVDLKLSE